MYTTESEIQFAICIAGEEDRDLEAWKVYRVLPDSKADEVACLRVIDESGEDYLYPKQRFVIVELPEDVRARLLATVEQ
ncbi:hypothetical protein [Leptodesmis sichuanensis]|uniref:hypothetical protein n=1 Tax=Leptodesmis sichuanensis TaxID=2906798 RepID=UPI001F3D58ED|nr:hypothetical protein [Leptodesmis sichuanensis]UIE40117.1 hypothetical protein KIK02_11580 [Leptodesmis sichuanensis A121]